MDPEPDDGCGDQGGHKLPNEAGHRGTVSLTRHG